MIKFDVKSFVYIISISSSWQSSSEDTVTTPVLKMVKNMAWSDNKTLL